MTIFDQTETRVNHLEGKLVKYDGKVIAIAGKFSAMVEEMDPAQMSWEQHSMSPVNGYSLLFGFTALTIEKSLFIFGELRFLRFDEKIYFQEDRQLKEIKYLSLMKRSECWSGMELLGVH